jgi:hypothetical protein
LEVTGASILTEVNLIFVVPCRPRTWIGLIFCHKLSNEKPRNLALETRIGQGHSGHIISDVKFTFIFGTGGYMGQERHFKSRGLYFSLWKKIFRTHPDRLQGPPSLLYNGYRVFPGGKSGRGVMLTTHPLLAPRLRKS